MNEIRTYLIMTGFILAGIGLYAQDHPCPDGWWCHQEEVLGEVVDAEEITATAALEVHRKVLILDKSNSNATQLLDAEDVNNFKVYVERGIVAEDLALADREVFLADYVFNEDYKLPSLEEQYAFVQQHKHLPGVIGQRDLDEQGYYRLNDMLIGQLKNLEELVLHTLAQEEKINTQKALIAEMESMIARLEVQINKSE